MNVECIAKEDHPFVTTNTCTSPQLVNPIWQAATTRQRHLAYGEGAGAPLL